MSDRKTVKFGDEMDVCQVTADQEKAKKHLERCLELYAIQMSECRYFIHENLSTAASNNHSTFKTWKRQNKVTSFTSKFSEAVVRQREHRQMRKLKEGNCILAP